MRSVLGSESMGKERSELEPFCFTAPPNSEEALAVYEKYQILHIKDRVEVAGELRRCWRGSAVDREVIVKTFCGEHENKGTKLDPETFLNNTDNVRNKGAFYVSCIVQGAKKLVNEFAGIADFEQPAFISDIWKGFRALTSVGILGLPRGRSS